MKNRIRSALNHELQGVRVGNDLKNRILSEAAGGMSSRRKKLPIAPVAAVAAAMVLLMLTAGLISMRKPRPDRRHQAFSDGGQSWVWVSESDALYHARRDCSGIEEPVRTLLEEAKAEGRSACRACITVAQPTNTPGPEQTDSAATEPIPEATETPANEMSDGALPMPTAQPEDVDDDVNMAIVSDEALPEATEQPEGAYDGMAIGSSEAFNDDFGASQADDLEYSDWNDLAQSHPISEGEILGTDARQVWATASGMYYHWDEHCSGMTGASLMDESIAAERGQRGCPLCRPEERAEDSDAVWMDEDGKYYHSNEQCQNLTGAVQTDAEMAILKYGCRPCPECVTEPDVYATTSGVYYHIACNCSGMMGADVMFYSDALLAGKKRCPICTESAVVYATTGGTYYHYLNGCSGMRGALMISEQEAVERGKLSCPVCMPMMTDGMSDEASIRLRAARSGAYLLVESDPAYSVCWIESADPVPVDVTSKQFRDVEMQMAECMSDEMLEKFVAGLASGTIRGARIVSYHKFLSGTSDSVVYGSETSKALLIDCGEDAAMETVTLSVGAVVEDWLIMPDGSANVSGGLIDLEPLSLLPDDDWAVLTARQSRGGPGTIEATVGVHGVTGEVRTEVFDQAPEAIDNARVSLITVADGQFVCVTQPEWAEALALGEEMSVYDFEVTVNGKPVALESAGSGFFNVGSAAYRLVDGPFEPDEIAISFWKHGVGFFINGEAMTVE